MSPVPDAPAPPSRPVVPRVPRQPWGVLVLAASFLTFPGMAAMTAAGVARDVNAWTMGLLQFVLFVAGIFLVGPVRPLGVTLFLAAVVWAWAWGVLVFLRSTTAADATAAPGGDHA